MPPSERARVVAFYEAELARHGPDDPRSLHWNSAHTQRARFDVLFEVGDWPGRSVADLGCGLGDLYGYLQQRGLKLDRAGEGAGPSAVRYTGFDITPKLVEAACAKYPGGCFLLMDVLESGFPERYDYVVASGTFSLRVKGHRQFLERAVEAMFRAAKEAVAFNFLGPSSYQNEEEDFYFGSQPAPIVDFCRTLSSSVVLREGYLSGDCTVFLYH